MNNSARRLLIVAYSICAALVISIAFAVLRDWLTRQVPDHQELVKALSGVTFAIALGYLSIFPLLKEFIPRDR